MRSLGASGIWELFVPGVGEGAKYKFEIRTQDGRLRLKADPLAFHTEVPPGERVGRAATRSTSGATRSGSSAARASDPLREPMSIYEVHLGSWRRNPLEDNRPLSYRELADELADYVSDLGFTHVELMPVMEHPVLRLVGLPGDRLLRADVALRHARRLPLPSSTACTSAASA